MSLLCLLPCAVLGAKTDIVEFGSSRMVGEVKQLDRGKLYFNTDSTGTIEIDWADVKVLVTSRNFRFERRDGGVGIASFQEGAEQSHLIIVSDEGQQSIPIQDVVAFEQLEEGFWKRLDISTSAGYSFTKSNGVEQLNFSADFAYDTENRSRDLSLSSQQSNSDSDEGSTRRTLDLQSIRFSNSAFFRGWRAGYEDNDALGLDYRFAAAWIGGREFFPLRNQRLRLLGGIDIIEEQFAGEDSQFGSELVLGGVLDWYKFRSPELDLSSTLTIYPSLTDSGRVRGSFDITLKWEIYDDLFWQLSFYDDYDSDASSEQGTDESASSNDYGVTTSIGWSW